MKRALIKFGLIIIFCLFFIQCNKEDTKLVYKTVNHSIIGVGEFKLDINQDSIDDYMFEIINLKQNNINFQYEDSLAVRVNSLNNNKILDNSTYSYADALNYGDKIEGNWSEIGVLGTIGDAGKFEGKGEKYLGIKFQVVKNFHYGWIKLNCSGLSDTLKIIDCAYNLGSNSVIRAGDK